MAVQAASISGGVALTNSPTGITKGGRRRASSAARASVT